LNAVCADEFEFVDAEFVVDREFGLAAEEPAAENSLKDLIW
jgi:hypothetical protein